MYCEQCGKDTEYIRVLKDETYNVLGTMPITFLMPITICESCGEDIFDEEIESLYMERAFQMCGLVYDESKRRWVKPE